MKSIVWYDADDHTIPQTNVFIDEREIFSHMEEWARRNWGRSDSFDEFWKENAEDIWLKAKQKDLTTSKIKTYSFWYVKNRGIEDLYSDIEQVVRDYLDEWRDENPEPEDEEPFEIDDSVIDEVLDDDGSKA